MLLMLDRDVLAMKEYCDEQLRLGGSQAAHTYKLIADHIRDMQPDFAELVATLRAWTADYQRRAEEMKRKKLDDLAEVLGDAANICQRTVDRLTSLPAGENSVEEGVSIEETMTASQWLWLELTKRFGPEVSAEIHNGYNRQNSLYHHARQMVRLSKWPRFDRRRRHVSF